MIIKAIINAVIALFTGIAVGLIANSNEVGLLISVILFCNFQLADKIDQIKNKDGI